jgi:hypothetical protein
VVKIIYGEKQVAPPRPASTENKLYGEGWNALRAEGKCTLDSAWGGHGGGSITFEIDEADFELLRADFSKWREVYDKYSLIHGNGWWADRQPDFNFVRVKPDGNQRKFGDFRITDEEFVALRKNHALFTDLYKKYYDTITSTGWTPLK